MVKEHKWAT